MATAKIFSLILILLSFSSNVGAEVFKYVDSSGRVHFVDSADKIPRKYKSQLKDVAPLPSISKVPSRKFQTLPKISRTQAESRGGKVEIFVTSWCGYCRQLEDLLRSKNVSYKTYDIEKDSKGKQLFQQLGGGGVPVTKVGSKIIRGYRPDEILTALGRS